MQKHLCDTEKMAVFRKNAEAGIYGKTDKPEPVRRNTTVKTAIFTEHLSRRRKNRKKKKVL